MYFGAESSKFNSLGFRLPPKPPTSAKDIRFSGDTKLCRTNECVIEVMNKSTPVTLECEINDGESWEIVDGNRRVMPCSEILVLGVNDISEIFVLRKSISAITPTIFSLFPAHPNPFNATTSIQFTTQEARYASSLKIYDVNGRLLETLLDKQLSPGKHTVHWIAEEVSSGVYFVILTSGEYSQSQKIILIK